jgi:hypothetical protein
VNQFFFTPYKDVILINGIGAGASVASALVGAGWCWSVLVGAGRCWSVLVGAGELGDIVL